VRRTLSELKQLPEDFDHEVIAKVKLNRLAKDEQSLRLQIQTAGWGRDKLAEIVAKAFELSQSLRQKWLGANPPAKWTILAIVCLN
jgi:hypothetical protein